MAGRASTTTVQAWGGTRSWDVGLLVARVIVGGIFILAGVTKLGATGEFASAIRAFHMMPEPLVVPFAFFGPWLELLVGLYLVAGFLTRIGAIGAGLMLIMFIVALADALFTGNTAHPCGCFGSASNPILTVLAGGDTVTWWDLIRDLIMLALTAVILVRGPGSYSVDALMSGR